MTESRDDKARQVNDGFGNAWQCPHGLDDLCRLSVVRPGKVQCPCDGGIEGLMRDIQLTEALAARSSSAPVDRNEVLEEAALAAENVRDGFTANIRTSEDEQELVRDPDGPWVLNSDIAAAIRALKAPVPESPPALPMSHGKNLGDRIDQLERDLAFSEECRRTLQAEVMRLQETRSASAEPVTLDSIEQYRMQMAGISTASMGYWKEGDPIHADYDTPALRDVAKLYAKYAALFEAQRSSTTAPVSARQPTHYLDRKTCMVYGSKEAAYAAGCVDGDLVGMTTVVSVSTASASAPTFAVNKGRWSTALYFSDYWWVKKSHAERALNETSAASSLDESRVRIGRLAAEVSPDAPVPESTARYRCKRCGADEEAARINHCTNGPCPMELA